MVCFCLVTSASFTYNVSVPHGRQRPHMPPTLRVKQPLQYLRSNTISHYSVSGTSTGGGAAASLVTVAFLVPPWLASSSAPIKAASPAASPPFFPVPLALPALLVEFRSSPLLS